VSLNLLLVQFQLLSQLVEKEAAVMGQIAIRCAEAARHAISVMLPLRDVGDSDEIVVIQVGKLARHLRNFNGKCSGDALVETRRVDRLI
jgi:hypothetical protein